MACLTLQGGLSKFPISSDYLCACAAKVSFTLALRGKGKFQLHCILLKKLFPLRAQLPLTH